MMRTLSIILLSLFLSSFTSGDKPSSTPKVAEVESTVIICTGKYSKRYHKSMCKGMKACKGDSKKVSLSDAKKLGLTPCGYCYK